MIPVNQRHNRQYQELILIINMDDRKPFQSTVIEKKILIEVTAREAHMIKIIRELDFGEIIVQKANGIPVRIQPKKSILLDETSGADLEKVVE